MADPELRMAATLSAPPEYCAQWLTDYRPDDMRLFEMDAESEVKRDGDTIHRAYPSPLGRVEQVITILTPTAWKVAARQLGETGQELFRYTVDEEVRPEASGSRYVANLRVFDIAPSVQGMMPDLVAGWNKMLSEGFERMKTEIDASFAAGKAATE